MIERMTKAEIAELNVRRTNRDGTAEVLCTKAFHEITALRAENKKLGKGAVEQAAACGRLLRELHAAQAENEKLRAALEGCIEILDDLKWNTGAVERARAALGEPTCASPADPPRS